MKKLILTILFLLISVCGYCQVYVNGYYKGNGTYVQPYYRTSPNKSTYDNYSTKGNYNPYTGNYGQKTIPSYPRATGSRRSYYNPVYGF